MCQGSVCSLKEFVWECENRHLFEKQEIFSEKRRDKKEVGQLECVECIYATPRSGYSCLIFTRGVELIIYK